jgi:hypothetical protein
MLSIARCKALLNKNGNNYKDEEVEKIRNFLYTLAKIEYRHFQKKYSHAKERHLIPKGIDRRTS